MSTQDPTSKLAGAGRWRRFIDGVKDTSELAKLAALVLAIFGILAIFFPGMKRAYERIVMPSSWHNVLLLSDPWSSPAPYLGARPRRYHSPAWSNGLNVTELYDLPGRIIYTVERVVGRQGPTAFSDVSSIHEAYTCLYVQDLRFSAYNGPGQRPLADPVRLQDLAGEGLEAHRNLLAALPVELRRPPPPNSCISEDDAREARTAGATPATPICPRIAVWARVQRLSC